MPKILVLDIETLPAVSFHFRHWQENIGPDMFKERSRIYSVGCKWLGASEVMYFEAPTINDQWHMLAHVHALLKEADAIVHYNGNSFDMPRLEGEFAEHGFQPLGKLTNIDVLDTVKTYKLPSNKLQYALEYFKCGRKVKTEGFPLWVKVYNGDANARKRMRTYCKGDVIGLDRLYRRLRPRMKNHPDLSNGVGCPVCSEAKHTHVAFRYTRLYTISKVRCRGCGHVYDGKRTRTRR